MNADALIAMLGLQAHPEGGHYTEEFRSRRIVTTSELPVARSAATAIYFLLRAGEFSALHRVSSDEMWHHYGGDPIELAIIDENGVRREALGPPLANGQRPLRVVPASAWQAARPLAGPHGYALAGCTVAPGFDFADFEMPNRAELLALLPQHAELVHALTHA